MAALEDDSINNDFSKIMKYWKHLRFRNFHDNQLLKILSSVKGQGRQTVHNFFLDVNKNKIEFKLPKEEVRDIRNAVNQIVNQLLILMSQVDPAFTCFKKCNVGSMAEDTRCAIPNEFDFIAILNKYSEPGAVKVERVSQPQKFEVTPLKRYYLLREHASIKFTDSTDKHVLERYKGTDWYREYEIQIFDKAFSKLIGTVVEKDTGTLSVLSKLHTLNEIYGPVRCLFVNWKNREAPEKTMRISIDVAIAIEIEGVSSIIKKEDVFHRQYMYYEQLNRVNRYLLLPMKQCDCKSSGVRPTDSACCQFTFTNTEVQLVKSLSFNHKLCLRILKYLFGESHIKKLCKALSSYLVKTCVLMHAVSCCNNSDTFQCIVDILCILRGCVLNNKNHGFVIVPCIFLDSAFHANVIRDINKCKIVRNYFKNIVIVFRDISQSPTYSFEESLSQLSKLTAEVRLSVESSSEDEEDMQCCNIL